MFFFFLYRPLFTCRKMTKNIRDLNFRDLVEILLLASVYYLLLELKRGW